mmetsp:Transcript_41773/g.82483  ORF Transcript_41773/g.82483 Transcript_41773/m.82483 type:complete len:214 (+) Transcript_41773:762-1403(+)
MPPTLSASRSFMQMLTDEDTALLTQVAQMKAVAVTAFGQRKAFFAPPAHVPVLTDSGSTAISAVLLALPVRADLFASTFSASFFSTAVRADTRASAEDAAPLHSAVLAESGSPALSTVVRLGTSVDAHSLGRRSSGALTSAVADCRHGRCNSSRRPSTSSLRSDGRHSRRLGGAVMILRLFFHVLQVHLMRLLLLLVQQHVGGHRSVGGSVSF